MAGMGTRFLPATKATPKEMLPVVDKPLIQYAVEEAVEAGITELVFITSSTKTPIIDHLDTNFELEYRLLQAGKTDQAETIRHIVPKGVSCFYVRQSEPLGLGHAVACAQEIIGHEPFAVLLPDDMIHSAGQSCLSQMISYATESGASVVAVEPVPLEQVSQYGVIDPVTISDRLHQLKGIVEKPPAALAPSRLSVVGRYVLQPEIFAFLAQENDRQDRAAGAEIQLTDAIARLIDVQDVFAYEFEGTRYDCGSKLGYMQANIEYALRHPVLRDKVQAYLDELTDSPLFRNHLQEQQQL